LTSAFINLLIAYENPGMVLIMNFRKFSEKRGQKAHLLTLLKV